MWFNVEYILKLKNGTLIDGGCLYYGENSLDVAYLLSERIPNIVEFTSITPSED